MLHDLILAEQPSFYYPLQDTTGTNCLDLSGNAHHGTFVNAPELSQASLLPKEPTALSVLFNATSSQQYVELPTTLEGAASFTAMFWGRVGAPAALTTEGQAADARRYLYSLQEAPFAYLDPATQGLVTGFRDTAGTLHSTPPTRPLMTGELFFGVSRYDGNTLTTQLNGEIAQSLSVPGKLLAHNSAAVSPRLGQHTLAGAALPFWGQLSHVAVWENLALSASKLRTFYDAVTYHVDGNYTTRLPLLGYVATCFRLDTGQCLGRRGFEGEAYRAPAHDYAGPVQVILAPRYGTPWTANTLYAPGDFVYPTAGSGVYYLYEVPLGGQSGATEPAWNTEVNSSTLHDSVNYRCRGWMPFPHTVAPLFPT